MKMLYGNLSLTGLGLTSTVDVLENAEIRRSIQSQIAGSLPVVVAVLICPRAEAERYRAGAASFIDRIFFQEEIEECIDFLKSTCRDLAGG
jgi:hypothetical protein